MIGLTRKILVIIMDYRSQVRIITTKNGFKELKKFNKEYFANNPNINNDDLINNLDFKEEIKDKVYFGWDRIKWYTGYKYVDLIMDGLAYLAKNDFSFSFSRMGDDLYDYDVLYYKSKVKKQSLNLPYIIRQFDDEKTKNNLEFEL